MFKSTECVTYSCEVTGGIAKCVKGNVTFEDRDCAKEVCENDKKVWVLKNLTAVCTNGTKCQVPYCDGDGQCQYLPKEPEGDDPCKIYTCDPATGNFSESLRCNDGLYCTEDICNEVSGECKYEPILCENKIPMEGYPCFVAQCREGDNDYKCVRKLMHNAYIDVCGNCIMEKVPETKSSSSSSSSDTSSHSSSETSETPASSASEPSAASVSEKSHGNEIPQSQSSIVDLLECTGAPPRPILTEGLAAASIALIIVAAVVLGSAITASGILGTKALIDRARQANNQSAHSNPLYQNNEAEMTNPAFAEAA